MSKPFPEGAPKGKIFPRNLTARAEYIVRGNPANTRPESGVDNSYPGLEMDNRNLEKQFFPGLYVEFHRNDGAIVRQVFAESAPAMAGLTQADVESGQVFLWALCPRPAEMPKVTPIIYARGLYGVDVWRRVHDLDKGKIALLLGPQQGFNVDLTVLDPTNALTILIQTAQESQVQRNADGSLAWALLIGDRAQYLDEDGVIDVDTFQPGELTRSLCAPWMYDFRDCACFYWSSNKPDVVSSPDLSVPYMDFEREDRAYTPDIPDNRARIKKQIQYGEMISGAWSHKLPVVLNDVEGEKFVPPLAPDPTKLWKRDEVIQELLYLASVEHALCVEYLYAHYSVNAPIRVSEHATGVQRRVWAAANEVFLVAVDEMRHLRWVNEALTILGPFNSVRRAQWIGRGQTDHPRYNGVEKKPFQLVSLTPDQLDWFIEVEAPSAQIDDGVDGMYVHLLDSVENQPDEFPERELLAPLFKMIIDEGADHHKRFCAVKENLRGIAPDEYLRDMRPVHDPRNRRLAQICNENYQTLLQTLEFTFNMGHEAGGVLLEEARRGMYNLHESNHLLASRGFQPPFLLPKEYESEETPLVALRGAPDGRNRKLLAIVNAIGVVAAASQEEAADEEEISPEEQQLLAKHRAAHARLWAEMRRHLFEEPS